MGKFDRIKKIWNIIVNEWKTRYRLVFSNEETHEQSFVITKITIQKIVVTVILTAFALIALTAILIALTPLRVYIPGYTNNTDYKLYKQTASKIDSLELTYEQNQEFIESFSDLLNGNVEKIYESDEPETATPDVHIAERNKDRIGKVENLLEETEKILGRVTDKGSSSSANVPTIEHAKISNISIYPPAMGVVTRVYDATQNHYGIDIATDKNAVITCVADGVVISANYTSTDGYSIIIQHPGNMISIYKRNAVLLKNVGARVTAGMPIATAGSTGLSEQSAQHLHFELWYNGFPLNPLNYLIIE